MTDQSKQNLQHRCDNCDGIDPDTCLLNSPNGELLHGYWGVLSSALTPYLRVMRHRHILVRQMLGGLATVRGEEMEILRARAERAEAAIARVRYLCQLTIAASCRVEAIHCAQDVLAELDDRVSEHLAALDGKGQPGG